MVANISGSEYKAADIEFPIIKISWKINFGLKRGLLYCFVAMVLIEVPLTPNMLYGVVHDCSNHIANAMDLL